MRWARSLFSSRKTIFFGLDITSSSIKLLELNRIDDHYCVQNFGQQDLPEQVIIGNLVQDIPALADAIRTLLIKLNLWSRSDIVLQAVIAVPDACTITKIIQVSEHFNEHDLEELASLELAKCIPESLEEIYYDFKRLPTSPQPGIHDLMIVAARAQYVRDRVAALRHLGLSVTVVDIESLALRRILPFLLPQQPQPGVTTILDLNDDLLKILFFKQNSLLSLYTEECGVASYPLAKYQESILQSYQRACHFLFAEFPNGGALSRILLIGNAALRYPDLPIWLQAQCAQLVSWANPFSSMQIADTCDSITLQRDASLYVTACGLAKRMC